MLWVLVPVGRGTKALDLALHTALQAWRFSPQLSEIHATVIAQPNTIVLHLAVALMLITVPCKQSVAWHFDGEKCLECWSMSVTVNSLDSHGEWSRSFLKSSRSYTFNSGFSWAGLGWRLVKELIHGLKSTGPRIEGTQGQAIFPVSQGWHQQLTSAFLCLARWRLQPLRFDKCSVCFFWVLSLQSPLCTRFDLVIVIWVIFIRVYKCLQRLLRLIQPLHEVPEAGLGQDYVSCKDTHAVDPGQLGGLCLKTVLRSWFPPSLTPETVLAEHDK